MENKNDSKIVSLIKKLYRYRLRIDRKGKTIVNLSSLFSIACLLFAPHMTIAGLILSLIMGYHINLETDSEDEELEKRIRDAAETVKKTATTAARSIKEEFNKARTENAGTKTSDAQAENAAAQKAEAESGHDPQAQAPAEPEETVNQDVVEDLKNHADDFQSNPAVYRSAYSASVGSVPTLQVHEEGNTTPDTGRKQYMQ